MWDGGGMKYVIVAAAMPDLVCDTFGSSANEQKLKLMIDKYGHTCFTC